MRLRRNTLNNLMMDNQRKNPLYQTLITDLAIVGAVERDDAEMLLGYEIPEFLHTPDGRTLTAKPADEDESAEDESDEDESDEDESDEKESE